MRKTVRAIFYNNPDLYPPIINSVRLLARRGFDVEIYCREDSKAWNISYPGNVKIHRLDTRARSSWREYNGFVKAVLHQAGGRQAIYIGHDMHGFLPARLLAGRHQGVLIYHCLDFADRRLPLPLGSRIVHAFEKRFARTSDLVIVPDAERGKVIRRELRLGRSPLVGANSPLKLSQPVTGRLKAKLAELNIHFDAILLRQGRIGAGHAIEATIRSIPLWQSKSWGFVIMGVGEPAYREKLSALAKSLKVENQFVALSPVSHDEILHFVVDANAGHALYEPLHLNHQYSTTASCKTMEYMAAGIPFVVSDKPSERALVGKYGCGVTADESSPECIAAAVNRLLGDQSRARAMGVAAHQAFTSEFCFDRQFEPVIDFLQAIEN